jgi:hypothetical protein
MERPRERTRLHIPPRFPLGRHNYLRRLRRHGVPGSIHEQLAFDDVMET